RLKGCGRQPLLHRNGDAMPAAPEFGVSRSQAGRLEGRCRRGLVWGVEDTASERQHLGVPARPFSMPTPATLDGTEDDAAAGYVVSAHAPVIWLAATGGPELLPVDRGEDSESRLRRRRRFGKKRQSEGQSQKCPYTSHASSSTPVWFARGQSGNPRHSRAAPGSDRTNDLHRQRKRRTRDPRRRL